MRHIKEALNLLFHGVKTSEREEMFATVQAWLGEMRDAPPDLQSLLKQLYETGFVICAGEITKKVPGVSSDDIEATEAILATLDAQKISLESHITSLFADSARVERAECIKAAKGEYVDAESTKEEADYAYNRAIDDVVRAIEGRGAEESNDVR